jgi:hypothetical protein
MPRKRSAWDAVVIAAVEADLLSAEDWERRALAHLGEAQAEAGAAAEQVRKMRAVLRWLMPPAPVAGVRDGPAVTELCLRALGGIGRIAATTEVRDWIVRDGHEVSYMQVAATLKYLAKTRRNRPVEFAGERGRPAWRLAAADKEGSQ